MAIQHLSRDNSSYSGKREKSSKSAFFYSSDASSGSQTKQCGLYGINPTSYTPTPSDVSCRGPFCRLYRSADKFLARPGRNQSTIPAFYETWRFITTFTSSPPPVPTLAKSIHSSAHHTFDRRSLFPSSSG